MKIGEIVRINQPDIYIKIIKKYRTKNANINISSRDIKDLMKNRSYKRGRGGAIRQVT